MSGMVSKDAKNINKAQLRFVNNTVTTDEKKWLYYYYMPIKSKKKFGTLKVRIY